MYILFLIGFTGLVLELLFIWFLLKRKKIAWIFLIIANCLPFIREWINYGSYPLPYSYYIYVLTEGILYLTISLLGLIFFTDNQPFRSAKSNLKKIIYIFIFFMITYCSLSLLNSSLTIAYNFELMPLYSLLLILSEIFFLFGLIMAALHYRLSIMILLISEIINICISNYSFIHAYNIYSFVSVIINVIIIFLLIRGWKLNGGSEENG